VNDVKVASMKKLVGLTAIAAVLTILFSFIGAPLLRVLRAAAGPRYYWVSGLLISALLGLVGAAPLAFLLWGLWLTIGIYGELEERAMAGFGAGFVAVLSGTLVTTLGSVFAFRVLGLNLIDVLHETIDSFLKQVPSTEEPTTLLSGVKIDADFLVSQIPSMIAILMLLSLAFALILDRRTAAILGLRFERVVSHMRLLEFRLPDFMIWFMMLSFLLSFLKVGIPIVSSIALNVFNVIFAIYFFQGLAVLETSFLVFKAGNFLRMMIYVFIVGQLFFLLSLIGIIDYWADFRRRLRGISTPEKSQKNGEHV
jgi:hypothetical protein